MHQCSLFGLRIQQKDRSRSNILCHLRMGTDSFLLCATLFHNSVSLYAACT